MIAHRGISIVLGTVFMGGIILTTVFSAVFVANQMVETQAQSVEFEQGRSALLLFATSAEDAALKPQSASHMVVHTRAGGMSFLRNVGTLSVTVNGSPLPGGVLSGVTVNRLAYRAGSAAHTVGLTYLRGNGSRIVTGFSDPVGHVATNESAGAWILLDYARVRLVRHGSFYLYNQSGVNEKTNLIELTFVNLLLGQSFGSGTIRVRVENLNVTTTAYRFAGNTVTIAVSFGGQTQSITIAGAADDRASVINVVRTNIRVSTT